MNQNDGQNKLGNNNPNQGVPNNQNGSSFNVLQSTIFYDFTVFLSIIFHTF